MSRIHTFDEFVGHDWLKTYMLSKLETNTLPHFIIIEGQEGLGKTSIADLVAIRLAYGKEPKKELVTSIIDNHQSTDLVKKFVMSVDGGKDMAKIVLAELKTNIHSSNKVLILDECHAMSDAAQDVFLSELEYIPNNIYIIMLTTEVHKLKATLRSRAVPIHITPLKLMDTVKILKREVENRKLNIQGGEATLQMIAEWSENKPRTALSILSAFKNESISEETIKEFIGYLNTDDVVQLLQLLSGSLVSGIDYISSMQLSESLIPIVSEFIKLKSGFHSYKLKHDTAMSGMKLLTEVSVDQLISFLYGITSQEKLTRKLVLNSFIKAHKGYKEILNTDSKTLLEAENNKRSDNTQIINKQVAKAPTLDSLLTGGKIVS